MLDASPERVNAVWAFPRWMLLYREKRTKVLKDDSKFTYFGGNNEGRYRLPLEWKLRLNPMKFACHYLRVPPSLHLFNQWH